MEGDYNGKPYEQMDDLGGKNPYIWFNTQIKDRHLSKLPPSRERIDGDRWPLLKFVIRLVRGSMSPASFGGLVDLPLYGSNLSKYGVIWVL